ncbi:MAG: nucleotidyltransferase family protein [Oscillospiraceae bacterium]
MNTMKIAGIIAEYNPFHRGHQYHIDQTRAAGATHIVAVMSGNVVQRGETALLDKHYRARKAVENGADLVIELPCPFSCASAEVFALAAVQILNALGAGTVEQLSFGAETADIETLENAARAASALRDSEMVRNFLTAGNSYPAALSKTVAIAYSERLAEVFLSPNNTLAIEYIKALEATDSHMVPHAVARAGARHDAEQPQDGFASASAVRALVRAGESADAWLPYSLSDYAGAYGDFRKLDKVILWKLVSMTREALAAVPDCPRELADRLYDAVQRDFPPTAAALAESCKSKNITLARIRRVMLFAVLGIKRRTFACPPIAACWRSTSAGVKSYRLQRKTTPH